MTDFFLVFLGGAWLAVFWPAARRARRNTPLFTSEGWRRRMQLIAPRTGAAGRWIIAPRSSGASDRAARRSYRRSLHRRKLALLAIAAAVPVTLVVAVAAGDGLWTVHLASYAVLAVYVALLVEAKRARLQSEDNVRSLAHRRRRPTYEWSPSGEFQRRA